MSLPTKEEWLDQWPEHEKGWTSRAIAAYPNDATATLTAENAALRAEVERLRQELDGLLLACEGEAALREGQKGSDV